MIIDVHAHAISAELAAEMTRGPWFGLHLENWRTADSPTRSPALCLPFFSTWKGGSGA